MTIRDSLAHVQELKPCPCCGSSASFKTDHGRDCSSTWIACSGCAMQTAREFWMGSDDLLRVVLTVTWNSRHGAGDAEDAANYQWIRKNLLWSKSYDGYVRWTVEIQMPEPGIHEGHQPVAETLDAAIRAARTGERG